MFDPLTGEEIKLLEQQLRLPFHDDLRRFYSECNGLSLFGESIAIDGLRRNYARSFPESMQPFSIVTPNALERPQSAPAAALFIGGYREDGSLLAMDYTTGRVVRTPRDDYREQFCWPSLAEMLILEATRLQKQMDR